MLSKREISPPNDSGAALISSMLIVSLMAIVALSIVESVRFASRLSINLETREQAQLYAIGAETFAKESVGNFWVPGQDRQPAVEQWVGQPFFFPIDSGGIQGEAKDGANCFNLNSLVSQGEGVDRVTNPVTLAEFTRLLRHLDMLDSEASALATATADWIDSDQVAGFSGAEDPFYGALDTPYRTAGGAMVEPSEIKRVRGMSLPLYERIRPHICTRPTLEVQAVNMNTLRAWNAPLLAAILDEEMAVSDALEIIEARPAGGFSDIAEIAESPQIRDLELDDEVLGRLGIKSRYVDLTVQVRYRDVFLDMISSLQIDETGDITTLSRRYGSAE
ncbi:MAG: type II secretion system minor pseudopilin GspK [Pseudomonadota bacterium]